MAGAPALPVLPPSYQFWTPRADIAFKLLVVRFEVGLAPRDIREPPYTVVKTTLRLHVPPERKPGKPPYWDFTSAGLIQRILALWLIAQDRALEQELELGLAMLEATSPDRERPMVLLVTRRNMDGEIVYELDFPPTW